MPTKTQSDIRTLLRDAREITHADEKGKALSKTKAAEELGITRLTYGMWEDGVWTPDLNNIGVLANFTGKNRDEIFSILARERGYISKNAHIEVRYTK